MKNEYLLLSLLILAGAALHCTSNPLFDDDKNTFDRHTISGTVTLQDGKTPDGIFVWLEDLNIHMYTSGNGSFSLSIPNTPDFRGLNGAYTIYFYLGNYRYSTASAIIRDGLFEYGERDISGDGKVKDIVPLAQLLSISTRILNEGLTIGQSDSLLIEVVLDKNTTLPVTASFYRDNRNMFTGFFIRKIGVSDIGADIFIHQSHRPVIETIGNSVTFSSALFWDGIRMNPGFVTLSSGEYEIFPYVFLEQEEVPSELISSFGPNARNISPDYLNIPFIQTTDTFFVSAD